MHAEPKAPALGAHTTSIVSARRRAGRVLRRRLIRLEELHYDKSLNIETTEAIKLDGLTITEGSRDDGHRYGAEPLSVSRAWLRELPAAKADFTFVDLGSGKGRVLLVAATNGFERCIGVEFARELHDAAELNLGRTRPESDRIQLILGDAGSFEYPLEPLVVHLNNPFNEHVMAQVIERLTETYERLPRPIAVVYQQSRYEGPATRTRNVELLAEVPFLTHRVVSTANRIRRWLVQPWRIDLFQTAEALDLLR